MKKTKKALASLAIAGMTLSMIPFNVFAASPVNRIAGVTAEQTAVQIAEQTGYTGTAILASSTSYGMVDALTAGPLAASLKAPILLTGAGSSLDAATKAELTKLAVKKVYVTSGTAVIKQSVIDELKGMGIEVEALGGFDRAETSVNIAKKMTGVTKVAVANTVVDALSIAAVASAANEPILLTDRDALPASVATYLASAGATASDVIGGTGVISDAVAAKLPSATRHAGMSAYDTNNQVIQDFAGSLQFDTVYVANGVTGIDALAGAPLAAQTKSPIVLTDGKTVPAAAKFTYDKSPVGAVVTALGGEFVVPESVRAGVAAGQVTPDTNELKIMSVSALNDANSVLEITFSKPLTKLEISDVTVQNKNTLARYGVKSVVLASSGLVATVELYSHDDADYSDPVLQRLTDYIFKVNANGSPISFTFNRQAYQKARISDIDAADRKIVVNGVTINVPEETKFDFQASLGAEVRAWYDKDNDLTNIAYEDEKSVTGKLEVTKTRNLGAGENGKVEIDGVEYKLGDSLDFYNNDAVAAIGADGAEYDYAKVFFDKNNEIEMVVSYDYDDFFVVSSTDEDVAVSYDDDELDLEDYIIFKDGKSISVSDLKKGDILYFENSSNDGDGIAEVYNKSVTGEIETVYIDKIKIDGKNYAFDATGEYGVAQYLDGDDFKNLDADQAEKFQAGGDVTAYLDRFGDVVYLEGSEGAVASNSISAYNVESIVAYRDNGLADKGMLDIEALDENGEDVIESFRISTLDKITVTDNTASPATELEYEVGEDDPNAPGTEIEEFRVLANGDIVTVDSAFAQISVVTTITRTAANTTNDLVMDITKDDDGNIKELQFYTLDTATATLELDDDYVQTASGKYKLQSDTVVYNASEGFDDVDDDGNIDVDEDIDNSGIIDGAEVDVDGDGTADNVNEFTPDADDITVVSWSDLASKGYDILEADVYPDEDGNVDYLVIKQTDASDDQTDLNAVITSVLRNSDNKVVEVTAFVDGEEKTFEVDEVSSAIVKGQSVVLRHNDDSSMIDEIFAAPAVRVTGVVTAIDLANKKVTVGGTQYRLISGGDVYDGTDTSDITEEQFREIGIGDTVDILLEEAGTVNAEVITIKTQDTVAPTVVKLGNGAADVTIAATATATLTFSEGLTAASKAAVEAALTAGSSEAITYGWNGANTVLTITGHATNVATFASDVSATVSDIAGNSATLLLVDSQ